MSLATAQDDRGTVPVQQLVDQNAHTLVTTDPTAWFSALEVGPHGFSRPGHRAHQKVVAAQRLHAECSLHAQDRQWAGRDTAVARRDHPSRCSQLRSELTSGQGGTVLARADGILFPRRGFRIRGPRPSAGSEFSASGMDRRCVIVVIPGVATNVDALATARTCAAVLVR